MRRRSSLILVAASVAVVATVILVTARTLTADERLVFSLHPTRSCIYPADPRNGGFVEKLFDFPTTRGREIVDALARHLRDRSDCIQESVASEGFGAGSTWHNKADTWRVSVTTEPEREGSAERVCRVDVIRKSSWVETAIFRLRGR